MLRATLCCGVLWGLSLGCAASSGTVRQEAPGPRSAAGPVTEAASPAAPPPATPPPATPPKASPRGLSRYGYTQEEPIKVGGGPQGEREYLQFLRGPEGQEVQFERQGSCCGFDDDTLPLGFGMLDMYEVTYDGLETPVTLFLDMYRREAPRAPAGFRLD